VTVGDAETRCEGCGADVRLWVRRDGQEWGPFDLATVRRGREEGRIVDTDEVRVGEGPWMAAGSLGFTAAVGMGKPMPTMAPAGRTVRIALTMLGVALVVACSAGGWTYYTWTRAQAEVRCRQNLMSIGLAMKAYSIGHEGKAATVDTGLALALAEYVAATTEWWTCPATHKPYLVAAGGARAAKDAVAWDQGTSKGLGPHGGKWMVLRADGTVDGATSAPPKGTAVRVTAAAKTGRARRVK
jgi:hypothetical protein